MNFSKFRLFGFLALSCSLISCGQPQANAPTVTSNATPIATSGGASSAIAQTTTTPQTPVAEKTPETQAAANGHSLLSASQQESLNSLGIQIALPKYVPAGFQTAEITTKPCTASDKKFCRSDPQYEVKYRNGENHCFAVSAVSGGVGGPDGGRYNREINTQLFGKVKVAVDMINRDRIMEPMTEDIANTPQKDISILPAGNSPFYFVNTCSETAFMTPNEFIKIVESLDWLPQSTQSTSSVSSAPSQEEVEENAQRQFEKIEKQPCDRQTKDEGSTRYAICTVQGTDNRPKVISASSSLIGAGDGIGYWFAEDGAVVAIRFFHSDELFLFSGDRLVAELTGGANSQRKSAKQGFTEQQRNRLEEQAKNRGADILAKFN